MAIWMLVSLALGMRVKCRRCRVLSTRAMLKSGRRQSGFVVLWCCGCVVVSIGYIPVYWNVCVDLPMPICFAFACAPSAATLAASSDSIGTCFVAMMNRVDGCSVRLKNSKSTVRSSSITLWAPQYISGTDTIARSMHKDVHKLE